MKKSPVDILSERPISFIATYSKSPIFHISFKGKEKKPKLEKGQEYWLPETYRIVDEMIQYKSDYPYKGDSPKWVEPTNMKRDFARYEISIVSAKSCKIKDIDKAVCVKFGIPQKNLNYSVSNPKPKTFRKSEELWRLKEFLNKSYDGEDTWEDNIELWLYEYHLKRVKPKYPNFLDKNFFAASK